VDARHRAEGHAEAAVDTLLEDDREAPEEVVLDAVDGIDLAGEGRKVESLFETSV
jgi:hypothetical protein